ncbi:MAG: pantetheine-phosphate adenylyltransferase [Bacteroidales bacterium]|nr:pantetheine-phosphate adenylyltransferase [Bacteroidales bacterium]
MKTAVFPGSFDPITLGHESIIRRALPLFDKIIIAIGTNIDKTGYFPLERRLDWIRSVFNGVEKIEIANYTGLTVDFCKEKGADFMIRGLRTSADFEFERSVAQVNMRLVQGIETIFFLTQPEHVMITSSIVREVHKCGGDVRQFVPQAMHNSI